MLHLYRSVCGRALALTSAMLVAPGAARAGDLNPPPGGVKPTMAPLSAIEPRVCINDLPSSPNAVHVISAPGNYFLRADVRGQAGLHGIVIDYSVMPPGSQVSIDPAGFSLLGAPGSGDGIHAVGTPSDGEGLRIRPHANVVTFIGAWGEDGIDVDGVELVSVYGVTVQMPVQDCFKASNSGGGGLVVTCETTHFLHGSAGMSVALSAGASNIVQLNDVVASGNSGAGIDIGMIDSTVGPVDNGKSSIAMQNVDSSGNGGDGVRVRVDRRHSVDMRADELHANGNSGRGVRLEGDRSASRDMSVDMDAATASGNGGEGFSLRDVVARLVRCVMRRNTLDGAVGDLADVEMVACSSSDNGGSGHLQVGGALTVEGGSFRHNGTGPVGGSGVLVDGAAPVIVNALCDDNGGPGVQVSNHGGAVYVQGATLRNNAGPGLLIDNTFGLPSGRVHLQSCLADGNAGDGFSLLSSSGGDIRGCVASSNSGSGFTISGVGHVFVWNSAADNGAAGYVLPPAGNSVGPLTDEVGMPTLTNPAANFVR